MTTVRKVRRYVRPTTAPPRKPRRVFDFLATVANGNGATERNIPATRRDLVTPLEVSFLQSLVALVVCLGLALILAFFDTCAGAVAMPVVGLVMIGVVTWQVMRLPVPDDVEPTPLGWAVTAGMVLTALICALAVIGLLVSPICGG
jgi:hypothetical protein